MKKILKLSLLSLLAWNSVVIAQPAPQITTWGLPMMTSLYIGFQGLDFQSRNGDQDYLQVLPPTISSTINVDTLSAHYHGGFRVFAGLNFCDDDLLMSWTRLNSKDQYAYGTPRNPSGALVVSVPRWESFSLWQNSYGRSRYDLDAIFLTMGHNVHLSVWDFRFAGGIEYVNLDSRFLVTSNLIFNPGSRYGHQAISRLKGIGPRVDGVMTYHLPFNFTVFTNANVALLSSTRSVVLNSLNPEEDSNVGVNLPRRTIYVPKLGMKMGVNYAYEWCMQDEKGNRALNSINLNAGWMVESYLHAVERVSNDLDNASTTLSNYGYQGFFFGVAVNTTWM